MRRGLIPEAMALHATAWSDLARRALEPTVFNDPAFALAAALHIRGGRRPRFLTAWDAHHPGRLIGLCCIAPPIPGWPPSAWLHPQATAAYPLLDATHAAAALASLLRQARGGLLVHGMPADGKTLGLIAAQPAWSIHRLEIRSRAVARDAPPVLDGKAGKEFRRQARRLADVGRVAISAAATPDAVGPALDAFLYLEAQGWKGRQGTALVQSPGLRHFTRSMLLALASEGRCRIYGLTLDDRAVAMGIVLRSGPTAFFWKTTFDEAFARFSPGAHLADAIGRLQALEPGLALTDSCAIPEHSMIDRLWPERMSVVDAFVASRPHLHLRQRFGFRLEQARRTLRARLKQAVIRRSARHGRPPQS